MSEVDHQETLRELNRNYVRAVDEADVAWFDANLASDFMNTNPDGSLIDRKSFLAQIARGSTVKNIREHDVLIRILGAFAIIHARTSYEKPDGARGSGAIPMIGNLETESGNASPPMCRVPKQQEIASSSRHAEAETWQISRPEALGRHTEL